ncbi:hypothetical protein V7S79_11610 [Aquirufa sp. ROCK-SH2]
MDIIAPAFAFLGIILFLCTLFAAVITILLVLKKEIPTTDKLLLILIVWLIPVIGSIIALYMLITQYKKDDNNY